jgi:MFS transporter, YNFM family, putative membrane transport protein
LSSPGPGPAPALSDSDTRRTVALLALASFASSVAMRLCDPLLPALAAEFAVGLPAAAATITGFALAYGLLQLAIGPLADRLGKYRVINLAVALAALATLAGALAPGMDTLVWTRVLAGGVAGAIIPVALAWIGDEVAYAQRQPVLARLMSGVLMGAVLGQLLSGLLADTLGWRAWCWRWR